MGRREIPLPRDYEHVLRDLCDPGPGAQDPVGRHHPDRGHEGHDPKTRALELGRRDRVVGLHEGRGAGFLPPDPPVERPAALWGPLRHGEALPERPDHWQRGHAQEPGRVVGGRHRFHQGHVTGRVGRKRRFFG